MIETPQIMETTALDVAYVSVITPRDQIQRVMGPAISSVYAAVARQGRTPTGPWFTHHTTIDPRVFAFDACVPVDRPIDQEGAVVAGEWPATRVARVVYAGPYEGLGAAWGSLRAWLAEHGHDIREDLYERYLVGPEATQDPAAYRTELNAPLR